MACIFSCVPVWSRSEKCAINNRISSILNWGCHFCHIKELPNFTSEKLSWTEWRISFEYPTSQWPRWFATTTTCSTFWESWQLGYRHFSCFFNANSSLSYDPFSGLPIRMPTFLVLPLRPARLNHQKAARHDHFHYWTGWLLWKNIIKLFISF